MEANITETELIVLLVGILRFIDSDKQRAVVADTRIATTPIEYPYTFQSQVETSFGNLNPKISGIAASKIKILENKMAGMAAKKPSRIAPR